MAQQDHLDLTVLKVQLELQDPLVPLVYQDPPVWQEALVRLV